MVERVERPSHVVDREPLEHEAASARAKPAQKRLGVPELPHCGAAATTTESVGAESAGARGRNEKGSHQNARAASTSTSGRAG